MRVVVVVGDLLLLLLLLLVVVKWRALVVAVTVLSLAISPLWVVTARRLHNFTANVNTLGELLMSIYAQEANIAALATSKIRPQFALASRRMKYMLRHIKIQKRLRSVASSARTFAARVSFYRLANVSNDNPAIGEAAKEEDNRGA